MLKVWVPVTPEHPAAAAAAAEHCAGTISQLCSQKCTLRTIADQWNADFSFTAGLNDSLQMPASLVDPDSIPHLCCCLHPLQQCLLVLGVCRGWRDISYRKESCAYHAQSIQLHLNPSQETWPVRQPSVICLQTWQIAFLLPPPASEEKRKKGLCFSLPWLMGGDLHPHSLVMAISLPLLQGHLCMSWKPFSTCDFSRPDLPRLFTKFCSNL